MQTSKIALLPLVTLQALVLCSCLSRKKQKIGSKRSILYACNYDNFFGLLRCVLFITANIFPFSVGTSQT